MREREREYFFLLLSPQGYVRWYIADLIGIPPPMGDRFTKVERALISRKPIAVKGIVESAAGGGDH